MNWISSMNVAINYIEINLLDKVDINLLSRILCCSTYEFKRIFSFIVGISLSEYIQFRKLSLSANEIRNTNNKIVDIAVKYGYDSHSSFTRAFKDFHGITPSAVRTNPNSKTRNYPRYTFDLIIGGIHKMEYQLEMIAKSYDKAIDFGRKGIDLYKDLPEHIKQDPDYPIFEKFRTEDEDSHSGRIEIKEYLAPKQGMDFIDLGCCLNLMFRGYDTWSSTYHGVDISNKTIQLLNEFVEKNKLSIGKLHCGSIHETPFDSNYFDIASCIGILEYFEKDFVTNAIIEAYRIIKPNGRFVLDVPDMGSPEYRITKKIEDHLGRPDKFEMSNQEFENMLQKYFKIDKKEKVGPMIQYFTSKKRLIE